MFYHCTQYCNSVRMTCSNKRLLILSYLTYLDRWPNHNSQPGPSAVKASAVTFGYRGRLFLCANVVLQTVSNTERRTFVAINPVKKQTQD